MEKKSPLKIIDEFNEKINRIKKSENYSISNSTENSKNKNQILKNKIQEISEKQNNEILKIYKSYVNPVSKEIENDEEEILELYEKYKILKNEKSEINNENQISKNYIFFESNISKKENYTLKNDFIILCAWFKYEKQILDYAPILIKNKNGFYRLTFIPENTKSYTIQEKQILKVVSEANQ